MPTTVTAPTVIEQEPRVVLNGISWGQYEKILEALPEHAGLRMVYLDGRLTLVSPLRRHDWSGKMLSFLVVSVANACDLVWEVAGHTTYRRQEHEAGVEGDDTYYFGANAELMRGSREVDLTTQPPPDLAIEVEATHSADDSVAVWSRLGVPEVWMLDVKRGTLVFGLRKDDGTYAPSSRSAALPLLEPGDVLEQLRLAEKLGSSRWYAQLDGWVRDVLLPRRGV